MSEGAWRPAPPTPSVFQLIAHLFAAEARLGPTTLLEAGPHWSVPALDRLEAFTVWGNAPAAGGSLPRAAEWVLRRERAVRAMQRSHHRLVRAVHRLPPAVLKSPLPPRARSFVLGGVVVELSEGGYVRVIDRVLQAAGGAERHAPRLRPSRDGSSLATIRIADESLSELRVATIGGRKDPGRNAEALATLEAHRIEPVPRLVGSGETEGTLWSTETRLSGGLPRRLTQALHREVVAFCSSLPRQAQATSLRERMLALGERYPRWESLTRQLAERDGGQGGILQHGDLWLGNLLAERGRLTGVIDWDTWHPAGVPGVDLLHVAAMERRRRTGDDIGTMWLSGLWKDPEFTGSARKYWSTLGIAPTDEFMEALGLDWWSGQLFKRQTFAARPGWLEANVDRVLQCIGGSR